MPQDVEASEQPQTKSSSHGRSQVWTEMVQSVVPTIKLILPGLVAVLVLSAITVTYATERAIGSSAFLMVPLLFLFGFPTPSTVGQHLETMVLAFGCGMLALGICFLSIAGSIWIDGAGQGPYATSRSRALGACTVVLLSLAGGFVTSTLPRFRSGVRAGLYLSIFCLTIGATEIQWSTIGQYVYPLGITLAVSLLCNLLIFPRTASEALPSLLSKILDDTARLVALTMDSSSTSPLDECIRRRQSVRTAISMLPREIEEASFEVHLGRVSASRFADLYQPIRRVNGWLSLTVGSQQDQKQSDHQVSPRNAGGDLPIHEADVAASTPSPMASSPTFQTAVDELTRELSGALSLSATVVRLVSGCIGSSSLDDSLLAPRDVPYRIPTRGSGMSFTLSMDGRYLPPGVALEERQRSLTSSVERFKKYLQTALDDFDDAETLLRTACSACPPDGPLRHRRPDLTARSSHADGSASPLGTAFWQGSMYQTSFLVVSLLEVSIEAIEMLKLSQGHLKDWEAQPRRRIWWPLVHWKKWLRQGTKQTRDSGPDFADAADVDEDDELGIPTSRPSGLTDEELYKRIFPADEEKRQFQRDDDVSISVPGRLSQVRQVFRRPSILRLRLWLSSTILTIRRSRSLRYAIKLALGMTLLSLPAWLPTSRDWYINIRGAWAVVSYFYVLETSTAATVLTAFYRLLATVAGAILGLAAFEVARGNAYGICVLVTVFAIAPAFIIARRKRQLALGVVMGITLGLVPLLAYTQRAVAGGGAVPSPPSAANLAGTRGAGVIVGILAALIVNLFLWPYHARVECLVHMSRSTVQLQQLYIALSRQMLHAGLVVTPESQIRFLKMETALEKRLTFTRSLVDVLDVEFSLVIRPVKVLRRALDHLDRLRNLFVALRQCREQGLRKVQSEAVLSVLGARRDFISSAVLCLWAVGQALKTRSPLPQFLPSPRAAMEELTLALRNELYKSRRDGRQSVDPTSPVAHAEGAAPRKTMPEALSELLHGVDPHWQSRSRRGRPRPHGLASHPESRVSSGTSTPNLPRPQSPVVGGSRGAATHPGSRSQSRSRRKRVNYSFFWIFAEHSIMASIIDEIEALLDETRDLYGEVTFIAEID